MKRFNVTFAKEIPNRDKPLWIRVGTAFDKQDGKPVRIKLDCLPIPNKDGDIWLTLFEADGRDNNSGDFDKVEGMDDSIPF